MTEICYENTFYALRIVGMDEDKYILAFEIDFEEDKVTFYGVEFNNLNDLNNAVNTMTLDFDITDDDDTMSFYIEGGCFKKLSLKRSSRSIFKGLLNKVEFPSFEVGLKFNKKAKAIIEVVHPTKKENLLASGVADDIEEKLDKMIKKYGAAPSFWAAASNACNKTLDKIEKLGKKWEAEGAAASSNRSDEPNDIKFENDESVHADYMDWGANEVIYSDGESQYVKRGNHYEKR